MHREPDAKEHYGEKNQQNQSQHRLTSLGARGSSRSRCAGPQITGPTAATRHRPDLLQRALLTPLEASGNAGMRQTATAQKIALDCQEVSFLPPGGTVRVRMSATCAYEGLANGATVFFGEGTVLSVEAESGSCNPPSLPPIRRGTPRCLGAGVLPSSGTTRLHPA
jgi:hypothetical protein